MTQALRAGGMAFLQVFAAGFLLGAVRTLVLEPRVGDVTAVLLEMPLMLGVCWYVVVRQVRRRALPRTVGVRAAMGGTALGLLLAAEFVLGAALEGGARGALAGWGSPAGLLGLGGQALFGLMPLAARRSS